MGKYFTLIFLSLLCSKALQAQVVTVQNGASVTIQSTALFRVTGGGMTSVDNSGAISNSGTITVDGHFDNKSSGVATLVAGSDYNVAGNWNNNGQVNADAASEVEFNGGALQNVTAIGGTATVWKFGTVRLNTPGLNLLSNMEVKNGGTLNFNNTGGSPANIVTTNANYLELGQGASVTGIVSPGPNLLQNYAFVNGNLRWLVNTGTSYVFPVGKLGTGTAQGAQTMQITFDGDPTTEGITHIQASYTDAFGANPNPLNACGAVSPSIYTGQWTFDAFNGGAAVTALAARKYDLSLTPRNVDISTGSPTKFATVMKHSGEADYHYVMNNGSPLTPAMHNGAETCQRVTNANGLTATGLNLFSSAKGVKDNSTNPFPVELLNFEAKPLTATILTSWVTASELNASHFDLERSADAKNFTTIKAGIPAQGTSTSAHSYTFEDTKVKTNVRYYYRLTQYDLNGSAHVSPVREAMLTGADAANFTATFYPNPAVNQLNLDLFLATKSSVRITFYDLLGQKIDSRSVRLESGSHTLSFDQTIENLAKGAYFAEVNVDGRKTVQKIVIYH